MARGLLLGNGINLHLGITDLNATKIFQRFISNLHIYEWIINSLFDVRITNDFLNKLQYHYENTGIEHVAGCLYMYIKDAHKGMWSVNDENRLQDLIACICLTSIFYNKNGLICRTYDNSKILAMQEYDYIFTLNYAEFWDDKHRCIHLHGDFDLDSSGDCKNVILVSECRMDLKEYAQAVDNIRRKCTVIEINPANIVFAPTTVKKNELLSVSGIYPSDKLFPADDLFLYMPKELYSELDVVDEIDVFGMSPYGDDMLIEKLNDKELVRVFVYNKDKSVETEEWKRKLKCKYKLLDSSELSIG